MKTVHNNENHVQKRYTIMKNIYKHMIKTQTIQTRKKYNRIQKRKPHANNDHIQKQQCTKTCANINRIYKNMNTTETHVQNGNPHTTTHISNIYRNEKHIQQDTYIYITENHTQQLKPHKHE